jgi:hypothetical protein
MKKTFLIIILLVIIRIAGYSQNSVFIEASINYSFLQNFELSKNNIQYSPGPGYGLYSPYWSKLNEDYDSKPGFDILIGIQKNISKKFNIESGLGLSMINYKRNKNTIFDLTGYTGLAHYIIIYSPGTSKEEFDKLFEKLGNSHIFYLTIPIDINYLKIKNKLSIGTGISSSIIIHSTQIRIVQISSILEKNTKSEGLNKFIFCANLKIDYCLAKNIWIIAKYQHAFSPVYEKREQFAGKAKLRLIKLGLRYYL